MSWWIAIILTRLFKLLVWVLPCTLMIILLLVLGRMDICLLSTFAIVAFIFRFLLLLHQFFLSLLLLLCYLLIVVFELNIRRCVLSVNLLMNFQLLSVLLLLRDLDNSDRLFFGFNVLFFHYLLLNNLHIALFVTIIFITWRSIMFFKLLYILFGFFIFVFIFFFFFFLFLHLLLLFISPFRILSISCLSLLVICSGIVFEF